MSKKYGSEKLTEVIRIHRKDWERIAELATLQGLNMADATHEILKKGLKQPEYQARNKADKIPGLLMEGNRIVAIQPQTQPCNMPEGYIPWYNPALHKTGDKVRMRDRSGRATIQIVPELDADGTPIG